MNKLIEDLLNIERAANESLVGLEEERIVQARLTEAEITRYLQEIKYKTIRAVEALKRAAEVSLVTELAEIESEYTQKAAQLQALFDTNTAIWREKWAAHVLGKP